MMKKTLSTGVLACVMLLLVFSPFLAIAQRPPVPTVPTLPYVQQAIGGVSLDANGVLQNTPQQILKQQRENLLKSAQEVSADFKQASPLRKISLKKLNAELQRCMDAGEDIADSVRYLGGLTSIRYVVAVPEEKDILLIGPGEGWTVSATGTIVGSHSGRPILQLEDLITLMRAWNSPTPEVITCSIDPTRDSYLRVRELQLQYRPGQNVQEYARNMEIASGMNEVKITGVPNTSRVARIIVAADYKLKQIGLGLEGAPRGFASYLGMIAKTMKQPENPRFWLTPNYTAIGHDVDRLTWDLGQCKVITMSESDYIDSQGNRAGSGQRELTAQHWAEKMTKDYGKLCKTEPVFAEVQNCMELAVAVAVMFRENLFNRSDCQPRHLWERDAIDLPKYEVPKSVKSLAKVEKSSRNTVVGCGGVEINPWSALELSKVNTELGNTRVSLLKRQSDLWWSN
ncbi:MAG: DUF1598 domain-containing protein [Thermoguttaceae bacterium]